MRRTLDYICMQPTRQGQASYAHVNEIVAGLRRRGWEVRLVEPSHPRPGRADGLRRAIAAATSQLAYLARCGFRPAPVVYIRSHFLALPTAIVARMAGSIVVQEVNGSAADAYEAWPQLRRLHGLLSIVSRAQIRMADAVVVVTAGLEEHTREQTGRRRGYFVIGNGADVDSFRPDAAQSAAGERYVVFVGALASWQGIDTLLDAAGSPLWPAGFRLVIAGDGKERGRIDLASRENPLVRPLGTIPYREVPALIAGSQAALVPMAEVPSSQFGLSKLKLFEAMACGVPVVVSDLPGLGDIVRMHDCGVTFPPGDADALASAVAGLAAQPERASAMGTRGRDATLVRYSWDVRAGQTDAMLVRVAAERVTRRRWGQR